MSFKKNFLSLTTASAILSLTGSAVFAETRCTIQTAKQSVSTATLCDCDIVTTGMLRYINRRSDIEDILQETLNECPAFYDVLTDFPTASIGDTARGSGDGYPNEKPEQPTGDGDNPGPNNDDTGNGDEGPPPKGGPDLGDPT